MTINGISGANTQAAQIGMNQAMDSTARTFRTRLPMHRNSYRSFLPTRK